MIDRNQNPPQISEPWDIPADRRLSAVLVRNILLAITLIGLVLAAWAILHTWPWQVHKPGRTTTAIVDVPMEKLPGAPADIEKTVESVTPQLPPDRARALNAAVPMVPGKTTPALPFRFSGTPEDRGRARLCLAAAALYEAGAGDAIGQQAVMQVILNRVRHPAFVPSVCGAVFQGSERKTGCQFTFTCDGSLRYTFSPDQWRTAATRADAALNGQVFTQVGLSTHYHTDWVYPYWSPSLDKLTRVGTHLFFRWRGFWGTRAAFAKPRAANEPRIAKLAMFAEHRDPTGAQSVIPATEATVSMSGDQTVPPPRIPIDPAKYDVSPAAMGGSVIMLVHPDGGGFLIAIPPTITKERFGKLAKGLCGLDSICRVQAWRDPDMVPRGYPFGPAARSALAYEYFRNLGDGTEYIFGS